MILCHLEVDIWDKEFNVSSDSAIGFRVAGRGAIWIRRQWEQMDLQMLDKHDNRNDIGIEFFIAENKK